MTDDRKGALCDDLRANGKKATEQSVALMGSDAATAGLLNRLAAYSEMSADAIESLEVDLREAVRLWEWAMPQELFAKNKANRENYDRLARKVGLKPMRLGRTDEEYEALCDEWGRAAWSRPKKQPVTFGKSITINCSRFNIDDQLAAILHNTARALWPTH